MTRGSDRRPVPLAELARPGAARVGLRFLGIPVEVAACGIRGWPFAPKRAVHAVPGPVCEFAAVSSFASRPYPRRRIPVPSATPSASAARCPASVNVRAAAQYGAYAQRQQPGRRRGPRAAVRDGRGEGAQGGVEAVARPDVDGPRGRVRRTRPAPGRAGPRRPADWPPMCPAAKTPAARQGPHRASAVPRAASSAAPYATGSGSSTKHRAGGQRLAIARPADCRHWWSACAAAPYAARPGSRAVAYAPSWTAPTYSGAAQGTPAGRPRGAVVRRTRGTAAGRPCERAVGRQRDREIGRARGTARDRRPEAFLRDAVPGISGPRPRQSLAPVQRGDLDDPVRIAVPRAGRPASANAATTARPIRASAAGA